MYYIINNKRFFLILNIVLSIILSSCMPNKNSSQGTISNLMTSSDLRSFKSGTGSNSKVVPVITFFKSDLSTINTGQSATLSFSISNASSISIDNNIGNVKNVGTVVVSPKVTTSYTMYASNSSGTVSKDVLITVLPTTRPAPVTSPTPVVVTPSPVVTPTPTPTPTVSLVCTPNSTQPCGINGTGSITCNSSGAAWGTCIISTCNPGYTLTSGLCISSTPTTSTTFDISVNSSLMSCQNSKGISSYGQNAIITGNGWNRIETPSNWNYQPTYPSQSGCLAGEGKVYTVNPSGTGVNNFKDPTGVPWLSLNPCDTIKIYAKPNLQAYNNALFIAARGAPNKFIEIIGVPDAAGNKPIFDGNNASMPLNAGMPAVFNGMGMIMVAPPDSSVAPAGYKPGYIRISGFKVINSKEKTTTGALNYYTNLSGAKVQWDGASGGIYGNGVEHLVVDNNELAYNGWGLFVNSSPSYSTVLADQRWQSRDLLVTHNYFHDNGSVTYPNGTHNSYTEVIGSTYEYNYYDSPLVAAYPDAMKERSSGIVVRYNYFHNGQTIIDLRDPQSNQDFERLQIDFLGAPLASMAFIYSNTIVVDSSDFNFGDPPIIVGYGDGGNPNNPSTNNHQVRYGNLFFYNNKVISNFSAGAYYSTVSLFDLVNNMTDNKLQSYATNLAAPGMSYVVALNNLFWDNGNVPFSLFYYQDGINPNSQYYWSQNLITHFSATTASSADNLIAVGIPFSLQNSNDLKGLGSLTANPLLFPEFLTVANPGSNGNYSTAAGSAFNNLNATLPADIGNRCLTPYDVSVISH